MHALRVAPDLAQGGSATIEPVHRRTATGDVWFLFNDSTRKVTRNRGSPPPAPRRRSISGRAGRRGSGATRGAAVASPSR
jgi:hypothetical protein